jgi:hypothetical protein
MKRSTAFAALAYIIVIAAALSGCGRQSAAPSPAPAAAEAGKAASGADAAADAASTRGSAPGAQASAAKDAMHISSGGGATAGVPASASAGKPGGNPEADLPSDPAAKPKVDAKDAYKEGKPTLLGLALKTPKNDVLAKLGSAKNKFVMDDDADPITVYEYAGFSVGFNKNDTLEFVDMRSADIDPGLHGLRIGQKLEDAVEALGKPDTNTSYVLTYKSEGTVLKLDLDPKNGTIRSIKLFASQ